ncbi:MAG: hypothetical protein MSH60_02665 [Ruminococcus sp.]|nr:hypothetical protein [Ruminococcus sp.]
MRFSFSKGSFCVAAALCLGVGLICYSKDRIADSVYTGISAESAPVIVLDAGHGAYAVSIVI